MLDRLGPRAKASLHALGHAFGLEVRLSGPSARDDLRLVKFLKDERVGLVLDIGANRGQFAGKLFNHGYAGSVLSFEALPDVHARLLSVAAALGPRWQVAPRAAISDKEGAGTFYCNVADTTSSLLKTSKDGLGRMPGATPAIECQVRLVPLDVVLGELGIDPRGAFLKIDVQGSESLVLAGAKGTLAVVKGLVVEMSLARLYEGQALFDELLPPLLELGFEVIDIWPGYRDPATLKLLQMDVVLLRKDHG